MVSLISLLCRYLALPMSKRRERGAEILTFVVGVVGGDGVAESVAGKVGVDLGGGDALVTQHLLHGAEVGTVLDELGGEAVAEGMGAHVFV